MMIMTIIRHSTTLESFWRATLVCASRGTKSSGLRTRHHSTLKSPGWHCMVESFRPFRAVEVEI
ncbi:hypothetical protein EZV62_002503 [Acer yangbiense]|uniref:Uncharacterized protein n=1 Tax=Acer yangbiense TaxID=1000413 RepID=A0A5C7IYG2_9ROSI|nr:hypothetical protein EZV62_002503 [Acer yangbiense]